MDSSLPTPTSRIAHDLINLVHAIFDAQGAPRTEFAAYGIDYNNDVFSMKPYCWCETDDCPVCAICSCPDSAYTYYINGRQVNMDTWMRGTDDGKRTFRGNKDLMCDWCAGRRKREPLFLHKPSGSTVSWYKYISRSLDADLCADWDAIIAECRASLKAVA